MLVKELLSDESKWTKHTYARNSVGEAVRASSDSACSWCVFGAIEKCYPDERLYEDIVHKLDDVVFSLFNDNFSTLAEWQDRPDTTFAMLRQVLERANV